MKRSGNDFYTSSKTQEWKRMGKSRGCSNKGFVYAFQIVLAILVVWTRGIEGNPFDITAPTNTAVLQGESAVLICTIGGFDGVVSWREYIIETVYGSVLSTKGVLNENHRFNGTYTIEGKYNLNIDAVDKDRSGVYGCLAADAGIFRYAYVVVIDPPVCSFKDDVDEGTYLDLTCSVTYGGTYQPKLMWYRENINDRIPDNGQIPGQQITLISARIQANASYDGATLGCWVSFDVPELSTMPNDGNHNRDIPSFTTTCTSNLTVRFSARDAEVNGVSNNSVINIGDKIRCLVSGNPTPYVIWYKSEGNSTNINVTGRTLVIEEDMIGYNRYTCVGTNVVAGIRHVTTNQVAFIVNDGDSGGGGGGQSGRSKAGAIAGGIIGALLVVAVVAAAVFIIITRRRNLEKLKSRETAANLASFRSTGSVNNYIWRPIHLFNKHVLKRPESNANENGNVEQAIGVVSQWEIPRDNLILKTKLGEGSFGQVMKAEAWKLPQLPGNAEVAVKMLKENASDKDKQDLMNELEVMKTLPHHVNVVSLLGCCTEKDPIMVVVEYVPYGNLKDFLTAKRATNRAEQEYNDLGEEAIEPRDLLSFGFQCAKGMEHISMHNLLHRDLAARNILVGEGGNCKVSDFGFARDVIDRNVYHRESQGPLPIRWMSPESIFDNVYTSKADVWSYGVLLWEIVTMGANPYPGMTGREVMTTIKKGIRMEKPDHCTEEIYAIVTACWAEEPDDRPSFTILTHMVEALLQDESDYLCLDDLQEELYVNAEAIRGTDEKL